MVVDSVEQYELTPPDSLTMAGGENNLPADSLATGSEADSVRRIIARERIVYHNDRTQEQSEEIANHLISSGVSASQLTTMVNAIDGGEESAITVRLRVFRLAGR